MITIRRTHPTFFDEFYNNFIAAANAETNPTIRPVHDIVENDNEFIVDFYLAGVKKEDITVDVENDTLTVKGERKASKEIKYNRKESIQGIFQKSFILPENVDKDNINASMEDGVLKILIPKFNKPNPSNKKILIK